MLVGDSMLAALAASAPHPEMAEVLRLFGQFVGAWEVAITNHTPEGPVHIEGEWHFGWILGGRAVQDVWIAPKLALRGNGFVGGGYGTTVRLYDAGIGAWRSTWFEPRTGLVRPFIARPIGGEIVLEQVDLAGSLEAGLASRWVFSRITPDSFHWRSVESRDGWASQTLLQEMNARRRDVRTPDV